MSHPYNTRSRSAATGSVVPSPHRPTQLGDVSPQAFPPPAPVARKARAKKPAAAAAPKPVPPVRQPSAEEIRIKQERASFRPEGPHETPVHKIMAEYLARGRALEQLLEDTVTAADCQAFCREVRAICDLVAPLGIYPEFMIDAVGHVWTLEIELGRPIGHLRGPWQEVNLVTTTSRCRPYEPIEMELDPYGMACHLNYPDIDYKQFARNMLEYWLERPDL
jgi:hypothetical protein